MKQKLSHSSSEEERREQRESEETRVAPLSFDTPEAMLRFDAQRTPPPAHLVARVRQTLAEEPKPPASGLRRWLDWFKRKS